MTKEFSLAPSFIASALVHLAVLALAATLIGQRSPLYEGNLISVALLDPSQQEAANHPVKEEIKRSVKAVPTQYRRESVRADTPQPPTTQNEMVKANESKTVPPPAHLTNVPTAGESGGSAPGADNRTTGDFAATPGSGNMGNGGGLAIVGLGRGSSAPGLPAQTVLRTNREAKPIQTARATYPPMALRMGLESDVLLKIEIDPDGKVTGAEIIKSGGPGFDEEALKAIKQSRFEPAQRDGQNVAAEFSYIYRFRLQK